VHPKPTTRPSLILQADPVAGRTLPGV